MAVVGEFDWIVSYDYLEPFFHSPEVGINDYHSTDILVIGCGTSPLSHSLATNLRARLVVSLDNDENCINYMKEKYKEYMNMQWLVHDLVESQNVDIENMRTASYELVVDKGTLDAVLVEGSIASMLCEIYRVLKTGGIYFLCSLHSPELLEPLFTSSPLEMTVTFLGDCGTEDGKCRTLVLCRKENTNHEIDLLQMSEAEATIMDTFYQDIHPLITNQEKEIISQIFGAKESLSLTQIHHLVFETTSAPLCNMDYSYELFIEDVKEYPLASQDEMTCQEFIQFLSAKQ
jgi:ubiquinone/menaquinone biosynthesis C-methylase UbiE